MSPVDRVELQRLCSAIWMSGRVVVEAADDGITIRKRYYPVAVAAWTMLIAGSIIYIVVTKITDPSFVIFFCSVGALIALTFIGLSCYLDTQPAILKWSSADHSLSIRGDVRDGGPVDGLVLAVGDVEFSNGSTVIRGEALYYKRTHPTALVPIYVERFRGALRKKLLERIKDGQFELTDAPAVNLRESQ